MSSHAITLRIIVAVDDDEIENAESVEEAALISARSGGMLDAEVIDYDGAEEPDS